MQYRPYLSGQTLAIMVLAFSLFGIGSIAAAEVLTSDSTTRPAAAPTTQPLPAQTAPADIDAYIASLHLPTVDEIIRSLEPIPTVEELLGPLSKPSDLSLPRPRSHEDPVHIDKQLQQMALARLLTSAQDNSSRTETLYCWGLYLSRSVYGDDSFQTTMLLGELAGLLARKGNLEAAERLYRKQWDLQRRAYGDDGATLAVRGLASVLRQKGDYAAAELLLRELLTRARQDHGNEYQGLDMYIEDLARLLQQKGDYAAAEPLFRELLSRARREHGDKDHLVIWRMHDLARVLRDRGKYAAAEPLCREALAIQREVLGAEAFATLMLLGEVVAGKGDHSQAATICDEALPAVRKEFCDDPWLTAAGLKRIAQVLHKVGRYAEAESLYREALATLRSVRGNEHSDVAESLDGLGVLLSEQGDYAGAEAMLGEALAMRRKLHGHEHSEVAKTLNKLGRLLYEKGDYAGAEDLMREGLIMLRRLLGDEAIDVASSLDSLSVLSWAKGDDANAESFCREALTIRRKHLGTEHSGVATSLSILGSVLFARGDYTGAEPLLREALALRRQLLGNAHPDTAISLNNLANLLMARDKPADAAALYNEALAAQRKLLGSEHPRVAKTLVNLSWCLLLSGNDSGAERLAGEALAMQRRLLGIEHPDVAMGLACLAHTRVREAEHAKAASLFGEALDILEGQRTRVIGDERQRAGVAGRLGLTEIAACLSATLLRLGRADEAFFALERGRGRAALDLLSRAERDLVADVRAAGRTEISAALDTALANEQAARIIAMTAEASLAATAKRSDLSTQHKQKLLDGQTNAVRRARRSLVDAEAVILAKLREVWPGTRPLTTEQIRASLQHGELLLCYSWLPDTVTLLTVPSATEGQVTGVFRAEDKDHAKRLADRVAKLHELTASPFGAASETDTLHSIGRQLSDDLLPHAIRDRLRAAKRLVILPDGPLASIPFEVLATTLPSSLREKPYHISKLLLKDGPEIIYAESGTIYANRPPERQEREGENAGTALTAVVLGDPVFDSVSTTRPSGIDKDLLPAKRSVELGIARFSALDQIRLYGVPLDQLPGTAGEVKSITQEFRCFDGSVTLLVGEDATLPKLEAAVQGKRFVHLATHGLTGSRERPYDASLALTQPETPTSDDIGFLTLDHLIRNWRGKLKGCELVVLSACDTQRGVKLGDSVMALPWGFMYAGAPTVVASLWKVNDWATMLLMTRFYENLLGSFEDPRQVAGNVLPAGKPMPKAQALREAKLWLRSLPAGEVRKRLGIESDEKWAEFLATLGYRGFDVNETVQAAATRPATPDVSDDTLLFMHPHYWAAFILIGDAE